MPQFDSGGAHRREIGHHPSFVIAAAAEKAAPPALIVGDTQIARGEIGGELRIVFGAPPHSLTHERVRSC
jgi:hypothetical protein